MAIKRRETKVSPATPSFYMEYTVPCKRKGSYKDRTRRFPVKGWDHKGNLGFPYSRGFQTQTVVPRPSLYYPLPRLYQNQIYHPI